MNTTLREWRIAPAKPEDMPRPDSWRRFGIQWVDHPESTP
jgi:hypothetical protein